jgi:hypothetical protein
VFELAKAQNQKIMRIALLILIGIHGVIHVFGFFKAFGIAEFNAIAHPISKTNGLFWLLACLLFAITVILILFQNDYWWLSGVVAVVVSQLLIFNFWSDAKFGTLANVIILVATIIGYSSFSFVHKIKEERTVLFKNAPSTEQKTVTEEALMDLPPVVQKWLAHSGVIGKETIGSVFLTQELQLKMKPEQEDWNHGTATQYFTITPPAFNWNIHTEMKPGLRVVGRDKFEDGKGEMIIKLLSLIPVANAKNDEKVNQATLQRYLAEIVWFPSAALSEYIEWEALDEFAARATMIYKGTKGSGEFYFQKDGTFKKFVAMRYQGSDAANPTKWTVTATKTEERHGITIPTVCEASWALEQGEWTWLKLKITDFQYNVHEMPSAN